eukprot:scaffold1634_cov353-Prasinococcus_capsulatus_cf.AAC.4
MRGITAADGVARQGLASQRRPNAREKDCARYPPQIVPDDARGAGRRRCGQAGECAPQLAAQPWVCVSHRGCVALNGGESRRFAMGVRRCGGAQKRCSRTSGQGIPCAQQQLPWEPDPGKKPGPARQSRARIGRQQWPIRAVRGAPFWGGAGAALQGHMRARRASAGRPLFARSAPCAGWPAARQNRHNRPSADEHRGEPAPRLTSCAAGRARGAAAGAHARVPRRDSREAAVVVAPGDRVAWQLPPELGGGWCAAVQRPEAVRFSPLVPGGNRRAQSGLGRASRCTRRWRNLVCPSGPSCDSPREQHHREEHLGCHQAP